MKNKFLKGLIASFALTVSGIVNAGLITIFTDEADFINAVNITGTYDFNSDTLGVFSNNDFGDFSIYENDSLITLSVANTSSIFTSNHIDFFTQCCNVPDTMFIEFDFEINAFGFDFSNEDPTSDFTVVTVDGQSFNVGSPRTNGFFGLISTSSFKLISFVDDPANGGANTSTKFDNFKYQAASVPEPSAIAFFALGLMGLASRKFKKQA
ncbi:PEP-CTERM sorting domain-containing protein [Alteromonas sp. MTD1]|uniref:PEP-CTERM sorting domain-containing protein n=1 Tax=Alteromonas sp. MTD1 TaxID=3057962 RepID=UPI0036F1A786